TQAGQDVAALVVRERRNACPVIIDAGGGYGTDTAAVLGRNGITVVSFLGQRPSMAKEREGNLGFINKRAEAWWRMREELNPDQDGGSCIALPPDPLIRADLSMPLYDI